MFLDVLSVTEYVDAIRLETQVISRIAAIAKFRGRIVLKQLATRGFVRENALRV
jgi:hypothetical protein